jgi:hypothetical protein
MLGSLLGSVNRERVLIYIFARGEGYAREIARFYNTSLLGIQQQLEKLEAGGILYSRPAGRTMLYAYSPRYPFLQELKSLLEKAVIFYPEDERERLLMRRTRPRRKDKPF